MYKTRLTLLCTLLLTLAPAYGADSDAGLRQCAKISADKDRLACFDALVTMIPAETNVSGSKPAKPRPITDEIGMDPVEEEETSAESFTVTIVNCERSSANRRVSFTLDNGQVWRQKNTRWLSLRDCKSTGVISEGYFGFKLYVDAMNQSYGVERVR